MCAAAARAEQSRGVAIVEVNQRRVTPGERADAVEAGDAAIHGEYAVCANQLETRAGRVGGLELGLQVGQIVVFIAIASGFTQAHPVDNAGVVQGVGDNGVLRAQQRLEQTAVGVETRWVEDAGLGVEKRRQGALQRFVQALRAADKAHRGHAVTPVF